MAPYLDDNKKRILQNLINGLSELEPKKRGEILELIENFTELDDEKKHALINTINKIMGCLLEMMDSIFDSNGPKILDSEDK